MQMPTRCLVTAALLLCAVAAQAADTPSFDVLKDMSVADFRATGLDKLSDAQIKALDSWFQGYQRQHPVNCPAASTAAAAAMSAAPVVQTNSAGQQESFPITAHLVGTFTGWSGATTFTLDNGQVWEQVDDDSLTVGALHNPLVTIHQGSVYSYYLTVEGVKDKVLVKRIKP